MANAVHGSSVGRGGFRRDRIWLAAMAAAGIGGVSAVLAFWRSAHAVETVLGGLALILGAYAQMQASHINQRWLSICGAIAGGFGLAMGIAYGGFP